MDTGKNLKAPFFAIALCLVLSLAPALHADVGDVTLLHTFDSGSGDGEWPYSQGLAVGGSTLYGMTRSGGAPDNGIIFSINTDGSGYTMLHEFEGRYTDGAFPEGSLTLSCSTLYGVTGNDGSAVQGTVFSINTDGSDYKVLYNFTRKNGDGGVSGGTLVIDGSTLYGTTRYGGDKDQGTVFSISTDGSGYTQLHHFMGGAGDGEKPFGSLLLSGSTLYGTTTEGGAMDEGTIFSINKDGTGFSVMHEFAGGAGDGREPKGSLVLDGSTFYGMTYNGGALDEGTIFSINSDGTGFSVIYEFEGGADNIDDPQGSLVLAGSKLYGAGADDGAWGEGGIFSINTDGSDYTLLHEFGENPGDGRVPKYGAPVISGSFLYGMTTYGGAIYDGTLYSLELDPCDLADTGDADCDGSIDFSDYRAMRGLIGEESGDPDYKESADINGDGKIWYDDLRLLIRQLRGR